MMNKYISDLNSFISQYSKLLSDLISEWRYIAVLSSYWFKSPLCVTQMINAVSGIKFFFETYDLDFFALHIAPYNENRVPGVIILSKGGSDSKLYRCLQPLILTGHIGTVISYELDPNLKKFIGGSISLIEIPRNLDFMLAQISLLIKTVIEASKYRSARVERLVHEINSLDMVTNDLYEKYRDKLKAIKEAIYDESKKAAIIATCPARSLAEGIVEAIYSKGYFHIDLIDPENIYSVDQLSKYRNVVMLYTETESHIVSRLISQIKMAGNIDLIDLNLKTDPISSSIYFRLLYLFFKERYMDAE